MITAIVLTKNEEKNIVDCLESLSFADEIIAIDDNSEDRTVEIAKRMEVKTFTRNLDDDFSGQRNFGLSKTKNDWVLFLDADERVNDELKKEILEFINNPQGFEGAYIRRMDYIWGRQLKYGEIANKKFLRLARKNSGKWLGAVHEEWIINGQTTTFKHPIVHYPHQSVAEFLKEINYYTDIRAQELFEKKVRVNWYSIILYTKLKFIQNYFFKLGFLDGLPGFIFALMMSFHSFLVRGKLWLLWQKK